MLFDGFETFHGYIYNDRFPEFWYENTATLEVGAAADLP